MVGGAADPASLAGGDVSLIWVFFPRSICARDLGIFFFIDSCYMRWNCTNRIAFLIIKVYLFLLLEGLNLSPDHYLLDLMILGFMSRMV